MKNIFTKTLTLIAFLSLSIGVWGGQYDLNFLFTKIGANTKEDVQAYTNCSSYDDKDKAIMDSDWEWNTGKDNLNNVGYFISMQNSPKACSHNEYEFPAGNVTVKLYAHFTSNDGIASFPVKIGTYTCNFDALSKDGPHSYKDYMYEGTINVVSAGTYRITVDFPSGDKMQVSHMTFDYAGGPTPPTPTTTDYYYHGAKNSWGWDKLTASETNLYAYYGPLQYNGTHEFYIRTAASDTGEKYGCNFTHSGFENTNITNMNSKDSQWDKGDNGNVAIYEGSDNSYYVLIFYPNTDINTTSNPKICAATELPYFAESGKTIYFDNSVFGTTPYFRIGRTNHNLAPVMSLVPGTANLYKFTTTGSDFYYKTYFAYAIANNCSWTGDNKSIYTVKTGDTYAITKSTNYIREGITGDLTIVPSTTSGMSDGCTYYNYDKSDGLLTHKASITAPEGGTITVSYKDINNADQSFTSGDEDLAHTCILTITATPNTGYNLTSLKVNDNAFTSGQTYTLTADAVITAEFACIQRTITVNSEDNNKGTVSGGGTYCQGSEVQISATPATGYEFDKWQDDITDNPRTITVSDAATYIAYFKEYVDVCNTLTIQCEDAFIWPEGKSKPSGVKIIPTDEDVYYQGSHPTDNPSYIDFKNIETEFFYYVKLYSDATVNFEVWITNGYHRYMNIYQKGRSGETITYQSNSYGKLSYHELGDGSNQPFSSKTVSSQNLTAGEYIIGLYGKGYTAIDQIILSAPDDEYVFCAEPQIDYTWSVYGNFDGEWKDYVMTDGVVTIPSLGRTTNYEFKLRKIADGGSEYTYYGAQNQDNNYNTSGTPWTLDGSYNVKLNTGAAGSYVFTATNLDQTHPQISINYPTAYSITFNDNGADGGTAMTNITNIASGGSETLPTMTRTKTGYRFTGWKDASSNDYADGATIENITSDITLTAQWETVVTVVTVTAEGGVNEITEGNTLQMSVAYTPADAAYGRSVTWSSSNTNLATISNEGLVEALQPGSVTITATSLNGVQGQYNLTIVASACGEGVWKMTYWPEGSGNKSEYCFTQIGETHEWRRDYTLPSVADWFSIGQVGGPNDHSKDWTFNALTTIGLQSNSDATNYYPGQDAVGYLRIFDNSTNDNYYVAFEPIYQALFGIENGSDPWTVLDFEKVANTDHEYETSTFQVPAGYKNNDNYKYYVGTKRANGTSQFVSGKSSTDKLYTVGGLNSSDMSGKYGKFHIWDNSPDNNWFCEFKRYYRLSYSGEGTEEYNPHYVLSTGSSSDRTVILGNVPDKTGYNPNGWKIGGTSYAAGANYTLTDDATADAQWTAKTYTITLDKGTQGTSDGSATATFDSNTLTNLTHVGTPTGYTLDGYYTAATDGTKVIAADGTLQTNVADYTDADGNWVKDADCILYAQWTINQHTLTWAGVEGATLTGDYTAAGLVNYGTALVAPTVSKTGYEFTSWTPTVAATMPDNDVTYTAQWNIITYSITYHDAGTHSNPTSYTIESSFDLTAPSARTGYEFLGWYTDAQYTNQITAITPGMHENKDIYAKWESEYCSNTLRIDCNRDVVLNETCNPNNESKFGTPESTTGYGLITEGSGGVGNMYFKFSTSANATIQFKVRMGNTYSDEDAHMYLYNEDENGSLEIGGIKYTEVSNDNLHKNNHEGYEWVTIDKSVSAGKHILRFYGYNYTIYDVCDLIADASVFCPEMYEVNFAANPSGKGTVTAQIKNGAAINSGDEVPENTVVVFTASDITEGYELVNWTDGESHELAGAVNSFEQKITSNITVNANIEEEAEKYTVTVIPGDHGSITSGAGEYREGATVTIVTAPDANYKVGSATSEQVDDFTIDGNNVSFTMPAAAVDVTINFVFDDVHNMIATGTSANINDTRLGGGGSITKSAVENGAFDHTVLQYDYNISNGDYCGYSLPKDAGYTPNPKATGFAFWFMTNDKVYMEIKADGNSKVFKLPNTNGEWHYIYLADEAAKTATSFEVWMNYEKDGWSMSNPQGTMYITEIQATNVTEMSPIVPPVDLTVVVSPNEGGTVVTSPATTTGLVKGTQVTLTASPADNYRFVNWTVGGTEVSTNAEYNYTVNANTTIYANFVRVYTLVVNHDEHIASVTGEGQYAAGESVTVTATATQGYKFTKWTAGQGGGELATTSSYTFDMPATDNYTVYANSEVDITYYQITLGPCTNGTIAATVGGLPYEGTDLTANTPVVLTAYPADGYGFVQWKDGSRENPHTIFANSETQDLNPWTATFAQQFTVTATYGQPGTSVTGGGEYPNGADVTLTANWTLESKDFTYGFKEWTDITGVNLSAEQKVSNPLTFTMPYSSVTMKATFAPVECTNTKTIQCETDGTYIKFIEQGHELSKYPSEIPHSENCGPFSDYYRDWHGTGYYDFKEATNTEMYYPVDLPASTYQFDIWSASNGDKDCYMNLYIESDDANPDIIYKDVSYKKTNYVTANNNCGAGGSFILSGTINGIVLNSPKSVIVGLHCNQSFGSFDQIVITATENVFCEEKDIETFTILSTESKEIPVSGVKNLVVYEGGQATNVDDVEVFETVKYIRSITETNINQWSTFAVPYTATKTQVSKGKDVDDIYPVWRMENGNEQAGYYFMEVLTNHNPEAIGIESRARWDMSYTQQPQKDSAYITMFPRAQSDGYFIGSEIFYIGDYKSSGGVTLTGSKNAFIENGGWPEEGKPKYYYFPNSAITAIQPYDAYVLSEDGTEFVITDHPTILPFQCYIQATTEFKELYPRLVIRQNSGGTTDLIPVTADGWNVSGVDKIMIDEVIYIVRDGKIYTVMGQLVK